MRSVGFPVSYIDPLNRVRLTCADDLVGAAAAAVEEPRGDHHCQGREGTRGGDDEE